MEDETLGFFKKTSSSHARLNVPALVQVAALAIIMIRGLDVLMIFTGERASLGALAVSVDTNHSRKLLVGGFAGVWLSGAVQHSR